MIVSILTGVFLAYAYFVVTQTKGLQRIVLLLLCAGAVTYYGCKAIAPNDSPWPALTQEESTDV